MVLQDVAEKCYGRCALCERSYFQAEFEEERSILKERYRSSPPKNKKEIEVILSENETEGDWFEMYLLSLLPKLIDYTKFKSSDFDEAVKTLAERNRDDLVELSGDFLYLCEPLLFRYDKLHKGLKKIPRPYRELVAAFQFWGIMCGDGISCYIDQTTKSFDLEVMKGFNTLGLNESAKAVKESRRLWNRWIYGYEDGIEDVLENIVYEEADGFDVILGNYLLRLTNA